MNYISCYKPIGLTPLQHIEALKEQNILPKDKKISYVGRLDPMAHGIMIYLVGDYCKKQEIYQNLPKKYIFKIAIGFETDTYDILGKIKNIGITNINQLKFNKELQKFVGTYDQQYPPFSSKRVNGKALWEHALDNNINNINIPFNKISVLYLKILNNSVIKFDELQENIIYKIKQMKSNNFRNKEILECWRKIKMNNSISIFEIEASVSTGTYIRSICHNLGLNLDTFAIAYDILRIKQGNEILL